MPERYCLVKGKATFWPPKPNELEIAALMTCHRHAVSLGLAPDSGHRRR
jgi:hypothetical protein